ncbi:MAG: HAD-IA family hydrolase [Caulobacter sp.]|nr:HAD-IA family hydrolase [Caulobacter sp.]
MHDPSKPLAGWTIAFDLDGTLVETAPDLIGALNTVLAEEGLPPVPYSDVRILVGRGAKFLVTKGFERAGAPLSDQDMPRLFSRFIEIYQSRIALESRPFPGCLDALADLTARGAALAVCTNKPQHLTEALLDALDMSGLFAAVVGGDVLPTQKPDPATLLLAIERAGGDRSRAILVGDASPDTGAAQAAGMPCVVVDFGYTLTPAAELGGTMVISSYATLPAVIACLAG